MTTEDGAHPGLMPIDFDDDELVAWLKTHFGPGRRFKSPRAWSVAAGLSHGAASAIIERRSGGDGRVKDQGVLPTTIAKLARAVGENPTRAFCLAGWLTEAEAADGLRPFETAVLAEARTVPPGAEEVFVDLVRAAALGARRLHADGASPVGPRGAGRPGK